jgi:curved DNA-binding protein CbpA
MPVARPDYYALLGVEADAEGDAIRTAYRALAKQHHPDLSEGEESQSTEQFIRIQEAYDVLRDPDTRAEYDRDRARRAAALEDVERLQRELSEWQARAGPATIPPPPRRPVLTRSRVFFLTTVLLVVGATAFVAWQRRESALQDQTTVVVTDPLRSAMHQADSRRGDKGTAGLPPDLGILSKEMERISREQVARVEAAKKRMEEQARENAKKEAEAALPRQPWVPPANVDCSGEGRAFSLKRENNNINVSFNGGPPVRPAINELGTGMIVLSKIEPTNRISLGFLKGDKDGTIVLVFDKAGNLFRTFGVDCTAAAF